LVKCEKAHELICAYLDGELDENTTAKVMAHLEKCPGCRQVMKDLGDVIDQVAKGDRFEKPEGLDDEIIEHLEREVLYMDEWDEPGKPTGRLRIVTTVLVAAACVTLVFGAFQIMKYGLKDGRKGMVATIKDESARRSKADKEILLADARRDKDENAKAHDDEAVTQFGRALKTAPAPMPEKSVPVASVVVKAKDAKAFFEAERIADRVEEEVKKTDKAPAADVKPGAALAKTEIEKKREVHAKKIVTKPEAAIGGREKGEVSKALKVADALDEGAGAAKTAETPDRLTLMRIPAESMAKKEIRANVPSTRPVISGVTAKGTTVDIKSRKAKNKDLRVVHGLIAAAAGKPGRAELAKFVSQALDGDLSVGKSLQKAIANNQIPPENRTDAVSLQNVVAANVGASEAIYPVPGKLVNVLRPNQKGWSFVWVVEPKKTVLVQTNLKQKLGTPARVRYLTYGKGTAWEFDGLTREQMKPEDYTTPLVAASGPANGLVRRRAGEKKTRAVEYQASASRPKRALGNMIVVFKSHEKKESK